MKYRKNVYIHRAEPDISEAVKYIIELKIWRGDEYHRKGEKQLADYLDCYKKEKGYLITFSFNKNKEPVSQMVECDGKKIFEVVV